MVNVRRLLLFCCQDPLLSSNPSYCCCFLLAYCGGKGEGKAKRVRHGFKSGTGPSSIQPMPDMCLNKPLKKVKRAVQPGVILGLSLVTCRTGQLTST